MLKFGSNLWGARPIDAAPYIRQHAPPPRAVRATIVWQTTPLFELSFSLFRPPLFSPARNAPRRVVVASTYTRIDGKMDLMWSGDLNINTVHVFDVVRAVYFAAKKLDAGTTWNLADSGKTTQALLSGVFASLFSIETNFLGSMMSNMAAVRACVRACVRVRACVCTVLFQIARFAGRAAAGTALDHRRRGGCLSYPIW